ncbi:MAG: lipoyl synthase [Actinomycetota bacterium]
MIKSSQPIQVRWLGPVSYGEAWALQQSLFDGAADHLILCEHDPVYTLGVRADDANVLVDPATVGATIERVNRGGDVTFHGPGQLVGYPIVSLPTKRGGGMADTAAYVHNLEEGLIAAVAELGLDAGRLSGFPGIWLDADGPTPRKLAAIGVRLSRGRTMHGFALNVDVDLDWFGHIVPCGIDDKAVTSLRAEGVDATMREVVDLVAAHVPAQILPGTTVERHDRVWRQPQSDLAPFTLGAGAGERIEPEAPSRNATPVRLKGRLAEAGVGGDGVASARKPEWMRVSLNTGEEYRRLKRVSRSLELTTVCEEAGCPNIFECWNEGTATFMLLGERCTRACGFCLVDTRRPEAVDEGEPARIAEAVEALGLDYAVLTMVARDDLDDGGAEIVARTVEAIHALDRPVGTEVLISDLRGSATSLQRVIDANPTVVNHNIETVLRLQRAVRPSASYARSLALLSRAKQAGMTTKSGLIVGMGETMPEVRATLVDLAAIGVDIVTIGQYLQPTSTHLPLQRWWTPEEFDELKLYGEHELGIGHVESSPLTRSSHHAGSAAASAGVAVSIGRIA